jgi:signal transduction histidine kinase/ActR/RegA family two-component response regulator
VASIVLPAMLFVAGSILAWNSVQDDARQGLKRSLAVVTEQATRVLDTQMLVVDRVNDLLGGLNDAAILADEANLRDRIIAMIRPYPQVTGILVVGGSAHALLSTQLFPVDPKLSFADRADYVRLQAPGRMSQIGAMVTSRVSGQPVFSVARRKGDDPQGFAGAIVATVSPHYFEAFDRTLVNDDRDYAITLFREDGIVLAGYPTGPGGIPEQQEPAAERDAIARQPLAGVVETGDSDSPSKWLIAYRKLDSYPVYGSVFRSKASLWAAWRGMMASHLLFGVPATLALVLLSLHAARRARRQEATFATLEAEVERRELAEEALRQAQKMDAVGRLTSGIAHDFNNHLTVISSNIELLKRRVPPANEGLLRLADSAMQGVQRAATLTHRLLAFSRQQPLDPEPLDAGRLVTGMSDLLRRTLGESIAIETVLAGGLWQTRLDANQLENALLNLAVNARDAMPDGGTLTIETANAEINEAYAAARPDARPGQYVVIAIGDTGSGMSPDTVARAFEPFFTTKPLGQASGLGLSMVYGFVRQSGGHVTIESRPAHGSTVRLYLPRHAPPEPAASASLPCGLAAREDGATILVVEDDDEVRRSSVEALREMGYAVLEAPDAMEAFRLVIDRGGIDLLFTDVGLPGGVNGRALADAARNASAGLKVLFTTGYTRHAVLDGGVVDRGVHFLAKPFTLQQLAHKVREALDAPASNAAAPVSSEVED